MLSSSPARAGGAPEHQAEPDVEEAAGRGTWRHAAFHVATTIATPAAYAPLPFAVASLGWPLGERNNSKCWQASSSVCSTISFTVLLCCDRRCLQLGCWDTGYMVLQFGCGLAVALERRETHQLPTPGTEHLWSLGLLVCLLLPAGGISRQQHCNPDRSRQQPQGRVQALPPHR